MVMKAFSNSEKHKTYSFYDLKLMQFYSKHCKNEGKKSMKWTMLFWAKQNIQFHHEDFFLYSLAEFFLFSFHGCRPRPHLLTCCHSPVTSTDPNAPGAPWEAVLSPGQLHAWNHSQCGGLAWTPQVAEPCRRLAYQWKWWLLPCQHKTWHTPLHCTPADLDVNASPAPIFPGPIPTPSRDLHSAQICYFHNIKSI